jgi:hypothetical protein
MSFVPEKKRNWINSERFQEFTNLIKEGVWENLLTNS